MQPSPAPELRADIFTDTRLFLRKLKKAVAVSGVCSGVLQENSGKVPGKFGRSRTTLNLKAGKAVPAFWPPFALYAKAFFPCSTALFLKNSDRAGPVLQEFGPVLRAGVWHSTSVVQVLPWGLRVVAYLVKNCWKNFPKSLKCYKF